MLDVLDSGSDNIGTFPKLSDAMITLIAKQPSDFTGGMFVIDAESSAGIISDRAGRATTNGALSFLFGKESFILGQCNAVGSPELTGANFKVSVFDKLIVKKFFHIWLERIFGAAGLVFGPIADKNVGGHSAEVVFIPAHGAGAVLPNASRASVFARWSSLYFDTLLRIVFKSSPVVMTESRACFTGMALTGEIRWRILEIVFKVFDGLAKRANMLSIRKGWGFWARQPVLLKKSLADHNIAKTTFDFGWTFHKYIVSGIPA